MTKPEETFDPYLKWLGIRPKDQPAHHYRLLGLDPFESEADVIANAADARMTHIKTFQAGAYSALSQRILNELATAKVCLLNPEKKSRYDAALRAQLQAAAPSPPAAPPPLPVDAPDLGMPREMDFDAIVAYQSPASTAGRSHRPAVPPYLWVMGGLLALLVIAAIAMFTSPDNSPRAERSTSTEGSLSSDVKEKPKQPVAEKPADGALQPGVSPKTKPADIEPKTASRQPKGLAKALQEGRIEPAPAPLSPRPVVASLPPPSAPDTKPITSVPPVHEKPIVPAPAVPAATASGKRPVPNAAARAAAEKTVRDLFEKDFAAAKTPQEKILLSEKLYKAAAESADDSSGQWVLFSQACDAGAAAGDVPPVMVAVDEIVKLYDFNPMEMKLRLLAKATEGRSGAPSEPMFQLVASTALMLMEEPISTDDFATAGKFAKVAVTVAKRTKNAVLQRIATERSRELDRLRERFKAVEEALATLANTPADPEANLTVGRWRCFTRGQWGEGLACLAKGGNSQLAALAKQDLAGAVGPEAATALADAWMKQADAEQDSAKPMARARAAYWCREAIPNLSGLRKAAAEKHLDQIMAAGTASPGRLRGEVRAGNVALAASGATVNSIGGSGQELIDGNLEAGSLTSGTANAPCPCQWTIEFDKVYRLQEIRLLLYTGSPANAFEYVIGVSADGQTFMPLVDRSHGSWTGWLRHQFPAQPVKAIRLIGLKASGGRFAAVELEAYCDPPTTLPTDVKPVDIPADNRPPRPPRRHRGQ